MPQKVQQILTVAHMVEPFQGLSCSQNGLKPRRNGFVWNGNGESTLLKLFNQLLEWRDCCNTINYCFCRLAAGPPVRKMKRDIITPKLCGQTLPIAKPNLWETQSSGGVRRGLRNRGTGGGCFFLERQLVCCRGFVLVHVSTYDSCSISFFFSFPSAKRGGLPVLKQRMTGCC